MVIFHPFLVLLSIFSVTLAYRLPPEAPITQNNSLHNDTSRNLDDHKLLNVTGQPLESYLFENNIALKNDTSSHLDHSSLMSTNENSNDANAQTGSSSKGSDLHRNISIIVGVLLAGVVFVIISCYLYKYHPKFCRACGPWLMLCEACDKPSNDINNIGSSQRPRNDCCKGDCGYPGSVCDLLCCLVPDSQGDDSDCKPSCECNDCGGDCGDCDCGSCDCGSCDCGDCAIM